MYTSAFNSNEDSDCFYDTLTNAILKCSDAQIAKSTFNPKTKPYWNNDVKMAHKNERNARKIWVTEGKPRGMQHDSYRNYKRFKNIFRKVQKAACDSYYDNMVKLIKLLTVISRQKPRNKGSCNELLFKDKCFHDPDEISNAFADYFKKYILQDLMILMMTV
ncbi:hypothetical protein KUTeg_023698 [Tegillarca granosa]|uniref:Uncharacterized protein n=1 Tax=Tegillarca granosa TaxID=220873 RepID=A0ABQ9E8K2_TEGGR|nr:hypothetical protein KUTeg_023698 [Tegillarca granosa]